jgi:hypothetical protein
MAADVVAGARAEAEQILADATRQAAEVNDASEKAIAEVRERLTAHAAVVDTDLQAKRDAWEAEETRRRSDLDQHVTTTHAETDASVQQRKADLDDEVSTTQAQLRAERAAWDTELVRLQTGAQTEHDELVAQTRATAEEQLASAAAHVAWTQEAMAELRSTAQAETAALRKQHHGELTDHVATVRQRTEVLLASATHRGQALVAEAEASSADIHARARAVLDAAENDAVQTRQRGEDEAMRLVEHARVEAQAHADRAERRLADAEAGARVIRERTATELETLQREAYGTARTTREEAIAMLAKARTDADQVRAEARALLDKARAEVTALARRRDDINAQLGHLSGVIEALAVPDGPGPGGPSTHQYATEEE